MRYKDPSQSLDMKDLEKSKNNDKTGYCCVSLQSSTHIHPILCWEKHEDPRVSQKV